MTSKKSILFISCYEIAYNPRLVKAADFYEKEGWKVHILTPITGLVQKDVYNNFINSRNWDVIEIDISKRTLPSKLLWLYVSIAHSLLKLLYKNFNWSSINTKLLNKALLGIPARKIPKCDIVYINLVNNLKYASRLKHKGYFKQLIYDSQEFFTGQYSNSNSYEKKWVLEVEKDHISNVDITCATTNCMKSAIYDKYSLKNLFRLRNLPYKNTEYFEPVKELTTLKLIWHGLSINYNTRGVNIIIQAVAKTNFPIQLTLQGNINEYQQNLIASELKALNIENKVTIAPASPPDSIVESLLKHDIGIIGELPLEDNQKLTSSNKLFDYIQAGLAVVTSDMPGIVETIDEYNVGAIYKAGDVEDLSNTLSNIYKNESLLKKYKENSKTASKELIWDNDFEPIFHKINSLL